MPLVNATPFATFDLGTVDRNGVPVALVIVKATYRVVNSETVVLADEQRPVRVNDVLRDEKNPRSSVRYPSDLCTEKAGTDVVVLGDAVSKKTAMAVDVAIRVRTTTVPIRVWGVRQFFRGVLEVPISGAVPFERMPVAFERAYGGAFEDLSYVEHRNPSGVGVAKPESSLVDRPAPQIEHPAFPHKTSKDRHPPIGCGAILPHWSPRREHAGTFDDVWKATRMPLMPRDFDIRHNNVAHPSLIFDPVLAGGDPVSILGMSHELFAFRIPRWPLVFTATYDDRIVEDRPAIDTLLVEPEPGLFEVTARHAFPIGRGRKMLQEVRVHADE